MKILSTAISLVAASCCALVAQVAPVQQPVKVSRVFLFSIDGMHNIDFETFIKNNPASTLATLAKTGVAYTNASASHPTDSFPGVLALVTGGGPNSTGVWYDASYDRKLVAPGSANCSTPGTAVTFDESIDKDSTKLDGGGGIDVTMLPLDPSKGCAPVYPHNYLRVNTIFEVARAAGLTTAWSDKHRGAYDLLNGPSGMGVTDLYSPEVASFKNDRPLTEAYDDGKIQEIINWIDGKNHDGTLSQPVPAIFGGNVQSVSVVEKLPTGGYTDTLGLAPSADLQDAIAHTDASIGKVVAELSAKNLLSSTLIVISAKHGQTPIDRTRRQIIPDHLIGDLVNAATSNTNLAANVTADDIGLIWLSDQTQTSAVVTALAAAQDQLGIEEILAGDSLKQLFNDPLTDSRVPDIIIIPRIGVIYAGAHATKIAEHGGFSRLDSNVILLVSNPSITPAVVKSPVQTAQIAPTILAAIGLAPGALLAVQMEHTQVLPGLGFDLLPGVPPMVAIQATPAQTGAKQIVLDASASTDPQGLPLTYQWTEIGGDYAAILHYNTATPIIEFGPGRPYTFQVTVTNSIGLSATQTVTIQYYGS